MDKVFNLYSKYYDLLYKEKDYPAETAYIIGLIQNYQQAASKSIIEFGSGTGKHAALLCAAGYEVEGVEPSNDMLEFAKGKQHERLSFHKGDMIHYKSGKTFDIALSLFHVVSYVNKNHDLVASFRNIHSQLKTGGLFIFDTWYTPAVLSQLPENRTKELENAEIKLVRKAIPQVHWNKNVIDVNYNIRIVNKQTTEVQVIKETHSMRHFSTPEIDLLAAVTGFSLLHTEAFLTGKNPSRETWGVCFILRKN